MTRMHVRSSMQCAQPTVWFERERSCAQDTEQIHGKQKQDLPRKIAQDIAENLRNYEGSVAKKQKGPDSEETERSIYATGEESSKQSPLDSDSGFAEQGEFLDGRKRIL